MVEQPFWKNHSVVNLTNIFPQTVPESEFKKKISLKTIPLRPIDILWVNSIGLPTRVSPKNRRTPKLNYLLAWPQGTNLFYPCEHHSQDRPRSPKRARREFKNINLAFQKKGTSRLAFCSSCSLAMDSKCTRSSSPKKTTVFLGKQKGKVQQGYWQVCADTPKMVFLLFWNNLV